MPDIPVGGDFSVFFICGRDIALLGWSLFISSALASCTQEPYDIPLRGLPVTLLCVGKED
ncbi:hypothetical protein [Cupriavidus basilensis]